MIPKILLQTSRHPYPQYLNDMWEERLDDSWTIKWFGDDDIIEFFDDNPLPEFPKIKEVFYSFTDGGHRADLFRYYYLYLNGGFFIDSDCITHINLNEIYSSKHDHIFVFSDIACNRESHPEIDGPVIFNGLMACAPRSKIIHEALNDAYTVKPRLLERQRLYFTYMLHVIARKHEAEYKIKWLDEVLHYRHAEVSHTADENGRLIASHYFSGNKVVPPQNLRYEVPTPDQVLVDNSEDPLGVTFFTTFNDVGYKVYGRAWVKTFIEVSKKHPHLRAKIYYEKFEPDIFHPAVEYRKFSEYIPHHAEWKMRYSMISPHMRYTKACTMRFSHKAFVMQHMWETTPKGYAIWLDGDCTFKDYDFSTFPYTLNNDALLACQVEIRTDTPVRHVESGFVSLNCSHREKEVFLEKFKENYSLREILRMPNDCYDTGNSGTWQQYGPYDGFIIHKSIVGSGVSFVDLNDYMRDPNNSNYTAHPEDTFLHPELNNRFIHNIGHEGKNRYEQVNNQLNIDKEFSWNAHRTDDEMTYTNLQNNEYPDIIEITSPSYRDETFSFYTHNPLKKDDRVSRLICADQLWEPDISDIIIDSMDPYGVFIEIGANIGWHSKLVQHAGYDIIAFEADPTNFSVLEMNCTKEGSELYDIDVTSKADAILLLCGKKTLSKVSVVKIDVQGKEIEFINSGKQFFGSLPKGCIIVINLKTKISHSDIELIKQMIEDNTSHCFVSIHIQNENSFEKISKPEIKVSNIAMNREENKSTLKLNLGAGHTRYDGFLNCDYDHNCGAEYVFNVETDVWPFDDNSVDEVKAHHILEHMGEGYFHFLKELYRVCKDGAVIEIVVPHHRHDNFHHDPTHRRPITVHGMHLFDKEINYTVSTPASKLGIYYDVDFRVTGYSATIDDRFAHLRSEPPEVAEYMAYTHCNVYCECTITMQVYKPIPITYDIIRLYYTHLRRKASPQDIAHYINLGFSVAEIEQSLIDSEEYSKLPKEL